MGRITNITFATGVIIGLAAAGIDRMNSDSRNEKYASVANDLRNSRDSTGRGRKFSQIGLDYSIMSDQFIDQIPGIKTGAYGWLLGKMVGERDYFEVDLYLSNGLTSTFSIDLALVEQYWQNNIASRNQ